jgi:hypothetical protein
MDAAQVEAFVMQYLEATHCRIIEKGTAYVTVKLSPQADKELTQRSYYWGFVERTGVEPETLTYCLVFDMLNNGIPAPVAAAGREAWSAATRVQQHETTFGSRRLEQIFQTVRNKGRWIHLFEEPASKRLKGVPPQGYSTWLGLNYKVELLCDMKRSEMHSFGISLTTGEIVEGFHETLQSKKLSPRLPLNVHLLPKQMTLERAAALTEHRLEAKIKRYDHRWAVEARERLKVEQNRMDDYYLGLLTAIEEDKKSEVEAQYLKRQQEIDWQYSPRIEASAINCGLFHLR